jgi:hypothetical protein
LRKWSATSGVSRGYPGGSLWVLPRMASHYPVANSCDGLDQTILKR